MPSLEVGSPEWFRRVAAMYPAPRPLTELPEHLMDRLARVLADGARRRLAREAAQPPTPPDHGQPAASEAA